MCILFLDCHLDIHLVYLDVTYLTDISDISRPNLDISGYFLIWDIWINIWKKSDISGCEGTSKPFVGSACDEEEEEEEDFAEGGN